MPDTRLSFLVLTLRPLLRSAASLPQTAALSASPHPRLFPLAFLLMNFFRTLVRRPNHRATLLELHRRGVVQIFRRHSIFRLWEPLREHPSRTEDYSG